MTRLETLCGRLPDGVDAALITSAVNRKYYTGFASSAGVLVAGRERQVFFTDSRYFEAAQAAVTDCEVHLQQKIYEQINMLLIEMGVRSLAVESDKVTLRTFQTYRQKLDGVELIDDDRLSLLIEEQRQIKAPAELKLIRQAQAVTDAAFSHILGYIRPGRTEKEIAMELEYFSRAHGSEGTAFDTIVVSGKNGSKPHGVPTDKKVENGEFITMDFGCVVGGYCSDMTRTVALGDVGEKQRDVYDTVLRAQLAAMDVIAPGVPCKAVDQAARDLIDAGPYKGCFGHGLGHSLGLDIHELPAFNTVCEQLLEPGMILSVEPGIYLPGEFGLRIEDLVIITDTGYENITESDKNLIIL